MTANPTRRRFLRAAAGAASAGGLASLSGCSSIPFVGGDGESPARDWLYDPTEFTAEPTVTLQYEAPSEIDAASEHLHPEVREQRATPMYTDDLDPAATDWAVVMADDLFQTPFQHAWGGSFGEAAARDAAVAPFDDAADPTEEGEIADLTHLSGGDGRSHAAYRDGLAASARAASTADFERLVEGAADGTDRLADVGEEVATFLDAVAFEHTAQFSVAPMRDDDSWRGSGSSYRIEGETTTVRWLSMNRDDYGEESLRTLGESVDGFREVSVDSDGPVRWVEAVAETDRLALDGTVFGLLELPFDG